MRSFFPLLALSSVAQALYFYVDGTTPKCFYEELPKDTLVVGHYKAEEWDEHRQAWWPHEGISIFISVDVRFPPPPYLQPLLPSANLSLPHYRKFSTTCTGW
jgi:hypothetical protein